MSRQSYIIGNWKMYKTGSEAVQFITELAPLVASSNPHVYLAVPFSSIYQAAMAAEKHHIVIGAQNIHDEKEGAFTGEVSALMLKDAGAEFVIIGHSERRKIFKEDDSFINRKVLQAMKNDLKVILCVGETLEERKQHKTEEVLSKQLEKGLKGVPKDYTDFIIAYEPVWAIGTGIAATPEIAQEVHSFLRVILSEQFSKNNAAKIPILYGGSVKPENISTLMEQSDIDGALVGGASLNVESFNKIVNF
ncbi:MAG: triose-phosphate isomerase [Chlamydiota bacterium]|jgi:triosephosphate isomerase